MADEKPLSVFASSQRPSEADLFRQAALFLVHLRKHGRPVQAARDAGFEGTEYINSLRRTNKEFADAYASVLESRKDLIDDAIVERAIHGVEKPVLFQGKQVDNPDGTPMFERTFSDGLLQTLARAENPEKYGEKSKVEHHHTGKVGVAVLPMRATSVEEWEQRALARREAERTLPAPAEDVKDAEFSEVPAKATELRRG